MHRTFCRNQHCLTRLWIAPIARWPVGQAEAAEATYLNPFSLGKGVAQRVEDGLHYQINIFGGEVRVGGGELDDEVGAGHGARFAIA